MESLIDLSDLLYESGNLSNPFTNKSNKIIFADDIASGRPCKIVDKYICESIYPYYSNTHSNSSCVIIMKDLVKKTKQIIRNVMNLSDTHKIIFSGNGTTGAVNHLVNKIDFLKYSKIIIHITPFEHHSNFLPWKEKINDLSKLGVFDNVNRSAKIQFIGNNNPDEFNLTLDIDSYIKSLDIELNSDTNNSSRLDIFSLTACSNVTGKRYDMQYKKLWNYIKLKRNKGHHIYMLLDCACIAPYTQIDLSESDGIYFSGHKFLGAQGTPGVLIINSEIMDVAHPYEPGGGCVEKADDKCTIYKTDPETKEMGGTPNIIGIIRLGYCLMIKQALNEKININEKIISQYVTNQMNILEDKYDNFKVIGLKFRSDSDLPIFPITIKGLHYNLITVLFNDLYGIQTRGGISCCGTLGRMCKDVLHIDGWCRLSFNYLLTKKQILTILEALEFIINNGKKYEQYYEYDKVKNLFIFKKK
jgi:selenocysteine lyase/cysteine desulfurase